MNTTIQGTNVRLTNKLRDFVDEKLEDCFRAFGDMNLEAVHVAIELERTTRRHPNEREDEQLYRAEANVSLPGRLIRAEESASDIYQAIVKLKHTLTREIRKWRERVSDGTRDGARRVKEAVSGAAPSSDLDKEEEKWAEEWQDTDEHAETSQKEATWKALEELGEDERDYV